MIFPTETFYGLGCLAADAAAVGRIYQLKRRPVQRPLPLLAADAAQAGNVVRLEAAPPELVARFWPGPLTLLLPARPGLPEPLLSAGGKAAVRVSPHPAGRPAGASGGRRADRQQRQSERASPGPHSGGIGPGTAVRPGGIGRCGRSAARSERGRTARRGRPSILAEPLPEPLPESPAARQAVARACACCVSARSAFGHSRMRLSLSVRSGRRAFPGVCRLPAPEAAQAGAKREP